MPQFPPATGLLGSLKADTLEWVIFLGRSRLKGSSWASKFARKVKYVLKVLFT